MGARTNTILVDFLYFFSFILSPLLQYAHFYSLSITSKFVYFVSCVCVICSWFYCVFFVQYMSSYWQTTVQSISNRWRSNFTLYIFNCIIFALNVYIISLNIYRNSLGFEISFIYSRIEMDSLSLIRLELALFFRSTYSLSFKFSTIFFSSHCEKNRFDFIFIFLCSGSFVWRIVKLCKMYGNLTWDEFNGDECNETRTHRESEKESQHTHAHAHSS